jgi:hypothetical protein
MCEDLDIPIPTKVGHRWTFHEKLLPAIVEHRNNHTLYIPSGFNEDGTRTIQDKLPDYDNSVGQRQILATNMDDDGNLFPNVLRDARKYVRTMPWTDVSQLHRESEVANDALNAQSHTTRVAVMNVVDIAGHIDPTVCVGDAAVVATGILGIGSYPTRKAVLTLGNRLHDLMTRPP